MLRMGTRRQAVFVRFTLFLSVVGVLCALYGQTNTQMMHAKRHLQDANDTSLYPDDLFLTKPYAESPNKWVLIFHFIGVLYMFAGLAIVCDDYFVTALDEMVENWNVRARTIKMFC